MTRLNASLCFLIAGLACVAALPYLPPPVFLGGLLLALLLLLWLYIRSKTRPAFLLLVMALLLGSWRGLDYGRQLGIQRLPEQLAGADLLIQGTIINLPEHTESGERFDLVLGHIVQAPASLPTAMLEAWQPGKLRLTAFHNPGTQDNWSELQPGQRWQLHVRLRPPRSTLNPDSFDYEGWLLQQGYGAVGYIRDDTRNIMLPTTVDAPVLLRVQLVFDQLAWQGWQWIQHHVDGQRRQALFAAMAIGYQHAFTRDDWDVLKNTGTIHLVVVSGLNIVLAASFGYVLAGMLVRLCALLLRIAPAPVWSAGGAMTSAIIYAGITGFSLPTQRSLLMVLCGLSTLVFRRRITASSAFLFALALVMWFDPLAATTPSLWLSFGAVGILLFVFSARYPWKNQRRAWYQRVTSASGVAIKTQCVVSAALVPVILCWIGSFPLITPAANFLAVPYATFILFPLALLAMAADLLHHSLGTFVLYICEPALDLFWLFLDTMQQYNDQIYLTAGVLPRWLIMVTGMVAVLVMMVPRGVFNSRATQFFCVCCLLLPLLFVWKENIPTGEMRLTVVDVGQGLSVLVETRQHITVYDVGDHYSGQFDIGRDVVASIVHRRGFANIDHLVLSHNDSDHVGGAAGLLTQLQATDIRSGMPEELQARLDAAALPTQQHVRACMRGQAWDQDGVAFNVLAPDADVAEGILAKHNNRSCVIQVRSRGVSVLLTGDIEAAREQALIDGKHSLQADILLVPHHGSLTSSSEHFLDAVHPGVALVSLGYRNVFGHPHPVITARYRQRGTSLWRTDESGAITVQTMDNHFQVSDERHRASYWHHW